MSRTNISRRLTLSMRHTLATDILSGLKCPSIPSPAASCAPFNLADYHFPCLIHLDCSSVGYGFGFLAAFGVLFFQKYRAIQEGSLGAET